MDPAPYVRNTLDFTIFVKVVYVRKPEEWEVNESKPARRSAKRDQIVETAIRLFSQHGAKRVTVEELSRQAGVSKVTFYKYFANKVALVRQIHDDWLDEGFRKFDEIDALDIPFPDKIDLMGRWKAEFASRVNAGFIEELIDVEHSRELGKQRFLRNIRRAQERGEIRPEIDLQILWLVLDKLGELFKDGDWQTVTGDFATFQSQIRTLLYHGMLTRPEGDP